jgi:hypothetical protein
MGSPQVARSHWGKAVKIGADSKHVAVASAASDKMLGIAQSDATNAEDEMEVALPGGGAKALAGGNISAGDLLTSDGSGKLIATTSNADRVHRDGDGIGCFK